MKKFSFINKLSGIFTLSFLVLFIFTACEIGLGPAVDLTAPVVTLNSHKDNDSVAQTFRLAGTASDNEAVTKLSIDFEEADIHYTIEPGKKWQKKTSTSDWVEIPEAKASCTLKDGVWNWFVDVNATEAKQGMGSNYLLEIVVEDALGNASKDSKINCSLIVDSKIPNVSIYKPDIVSTYSKAEQNYTSYDSINGNTFLNLLNGAITFYGRQDGSASFRELRIELDDGNTDDCVISDNVPVIKDPTTQKIAEAYSFGETKKYYTKTLIRDGEDVIDLRNWELTVIPLEWMTTANSELATGKHLIRIITTSISNSDAWERKVVGYFVWWPEADTPWVTANDGGLDDSNYVQIFPSAPISGIAYDDDGIANLSYTFEKKSDSGDYSVFEELEDIKLTLSEENAKTSAWSVRAPADEGIYRLTLKIKDINGKEGESLVRYFKTLDTHAPTITLNYNSNALADANGNITFTGNTSDDGKVNSLKVIFLNPNLNDDPSNSNRYSLGKETFWNANNKTYDDYGNKIFTINLGTPVYDNIAKQNIYAFTKQLNLFTDLDIGSGNAKKPLETLNFVFRAIDNGDDGGTPTVEQISLSGDTQAPVLNITSIRQYSSSNTAKTEELNWNNDNVPNLAVVADGDYVILKGNWSDNSVKAWNYDTNKIGPVSFTWGSAVFTPQSLAKQSDGSFNFTYKVTGIPQKATPITASITDYGRNTTSVTKSVFIETTTLELERVGANTNDGVYKAGDTIYLFLEFTKNTHVEGTPRLKLNMGSGNSTRYATFDSSNDKAQIIFKYEVKAGDNIANLDVLGIDGGTWSDANVSGSSAFTPVLPTDDTKKLGTSRNIRIDTTAPKVTRIESLTPAGDYKEGAQILLKLSFSESVKITNEGNITIGLKDITSRSMSAVLSGSDVILTYTVGAGDNASPLETTANSITHTNVTVTDEVGNAITATGWNLAATSFTGIIIDNKKPFPPTVNAGWGTKEVSTSEAGESFTITGEKDATIEYTIDGGTNWQTYHSKVTLANNGNYTVQAKQTDIAGNTCENPSAAKSIIIDRGALFTGVTVTNPAGKYKTGTTITGQINFRKEVSLPSDAKISLNVKRGTSALPAISIDNPTTPASTFNFTYTVDANDSIDTTNNTNGYLNVKSWSFDSVSVLYDGVTKSVPVSFDSTKNITTTKNIQLMTGYPAYTNATLSADNKTLTITFDRQISKVSSTKEIVLEMTDVFKAPAVLTESEYNDLAAVISGLDTYYEAGVNGAATNGTKLKPDTTTKYILKYSYAHDNSDLVTLFKNANKHKVKVPLYSSNVKASGNTLTVNLTGAYAIPVKGATYKLTIPVGIVQDEVQNQNNVESTKTGIVASGVELPVIRIKKDDQTIVSGATTAAATVTMPDTAEMTIDCQTPGATITFAKTESSSTLITIKDCKTHTATYGNDTNNTKLTTDDVDYPTTGFTTYSTKQTLGAAIGNYDAATGLKIAIVAKATKNGVTETSYEYATRSVLKFNLSTTQRWANNRWNSRDYDIGGGYAIIPDTDVELCDLPIWVQGGDAPAGGNVIAGFPLAWDDCSTYKLMACDRSYTKSNYGNNNNVTNTNLTANEGQTAFSTEGTWKEMHTYWYWVTWDISSPCYTGFAVGDVPADAATAGPKNWYVGECSWAAIKQNTALYPGETLELSLDGVSNTDDNDNTRGTYLFRTKNKGHRD